MKSQTDIPPEILVLVVNETGEVIRIDEDYQEVVRFVALESVKSLNDIPKGVNHLCISGKLIPQTRRNLQDIAEKRGVKPSFYYAPADISNRVVDALRREVNFFQPLGAAEVGESQDSLLEKKTELENIVLKKEAEHPKETSRSLAGKIWRYLMTEFPDKYRGLRKVAVLRIILNARKNRRENKKQEKKWL